MLCYDILLKEKVIKNSQNLKNDLYCQVFNNNKNRKQKKTKTTQNN